MAFYMIFLLLGLHVHASLGGTLTVIDYGGQCAVWSGDNYGCTGSSETFSLIKGNDCSQLSKVVDGLRVEMATLNVGICGTQEGRPVAWIEIKKSGHVTFSNKDGAQAGCKLDDSFKVGSSCTVSNAIKSPTASTTSTLKTSSTTTVTSQAAESTSESSILVASPTSYESEPTASPTVDDLSTAVLSSTSSGLPTCHVTSE
ncbi:uncharacterized protein N7506_000054 [Penicillium brevicompactum]|uniref:uncharacterized protein n=1 Tax=Penicillium brevicompactum TaxID=5074 RepID=UPI002540D5F6|nr:uncharacterized protein N7506_000054 [Penicillium brevicompactum]KAJ5346801.1 hypothetical protein N7506_000054 [Penicillium brevicompactum]